MLMRFSHDRIVIMHHKTFIIDGVRTPFIRSSGAFSSLMAYELGVYAANGLVNKTGVKAADIQYACFGSVLADPRTSNLAREIVLASSLEESTPAHTVTMACISSNVATTTLSDMISLGHIDCGIAGGAETFSDLPIRYSKKLRELMLGFKKSKNLLGRLKLISAVGIKDFKPDIPRAEEFSVGISMGEAGDMLASQFKITRKEADDFALLSHKRAARAWEQGFYANQVVPVSLAKNIIINEDNGPRPHSTPKMLADLKPAFNRFGLNTAANSSFFSDGASALLCAHGDFIKKHKLTPLSSIEDYYYSASDPLDELLLGPALSVPRLLEKNGLSIADIQVWEVHEAFAGQVLAIIKALASKEFCRTRLGLKEALGEIPLESVNLWGGSLSLGHPFGATGARLILTASQRLVHEKGNFAVVTGCAAGGLGSAILLKRA